MKRKKSSDIEYSKKIYNRLTIMVWIIVVFSMFMSYRTNDTAVLSYLIPAAFGALATGTGFYFYKAKAENEIKLAQLYKQLDLEHEIDDDYPEESQNENYGGRI